MSPLKVSIFSEIRKFYSDDSVKDFVKKYNIEDIVSLDDENMNKILFHHPDGLRLSLAGFIIIRKVFTAYSFSIPKGLKSRHRFGMSKIEFPYFSSVSRLVLFSEMDASVVTLCGGVERFLETNSHIDSY